MHARAFNTPIHLDRADPFSKSLLCICVCAKSFQGGTLGACLRRQNYLTKQINDAVPPPSDPAAYLLMEDLRTG